jgi:uncharacterized protein YegP (UPF0339 family)
MAATFELKKSGEQFMFHFKGANGETVVTSERYVSKSGAEAGISSVKANASTDARYERKSSLSGQPYFVLRAVNREIIGTSEMYSSPRARDAGIASVKAKAPGAPTQDMTG